MESPYLEIFKCYHIVLSNCLQVSLLEQGCWIRWCTDLFFSLLIQEIPATSSIDFGSIWTNSLWIVLMHEWRKRCSGVEDRHTSITAFMYFVIIWERHRREKKVSLKKMVSVMIWFVCQVFPPAGILGFKLYSVGSLHCFYWQWKNAWEKYMFPKSQFLNFICFIK